MPEIIRFLTEKASRKFNGIVMYAAVVFFMVTVSDNEILTKDSAILG
jgi:hypothetical protein